MSSIPTCTVKAYREGTQLMVALEGLLRLGNSEAVKNQVSKLSEGCETIQLYIGQLTDVDSAGLGVIVGLHMLSRSRKQQLKVLAPTMYVTRLFESTRLTSVLQLVTGTEAELAKAHFMRPELAVDGTAQDAA